VIDSKEKRIIGELMIAIANERGMSQRDLASRAGCGQPTISNIKKGVGSDDRFESVANAIECTIGLIDGEHVLIDQLTGEPAELDDAGPAEVEKPEPKAEKKAGPKKAPSRKRRKAAPKKVESPIGDATLKYLKWAAEQSDIEDLDVFLIKLVGEHLASS